MLSELEFLISLRTGEWPAGVLLSACDALLLLLHIMTCSMCSSSCVRSYKQCAPTRITMLQLALPLDSSEIQACPMPTLACTPRAFHPPAHMLCFSLNTQVTDTSMALTLNTPTSTLPPASVDARATAKLLGAALGGSEGDIEMGSSISTGYAPRWVQVRFTNMYTIHIHTRSLQPALHVGTHPVMGDAGI